MQDHRLAADVTQWRQRWDISAEELEQLHAGIPTTSGRQLSEAASQELVEVVEQHARRLLAGME